MLWMINLIANIKVVGIKLLGIFLIWLGIAISIIIKFLRILMAV
jgi:hypothetical protein